MNQTVKTIISIIVALIIIYLAYTLLSGPTEPEEPVIAEPLTVNLLAINDSGQEGQALIQEFLPEAEETEATEKTEEEISKQLKVTVNLTSVVAEEEVVETATEEAATEETEETEEATEEEAETAEITIQTANIHTGTCEELGDVVYQLNDISDSASETILELDMEQLLAQLPLSINADDISCGDIVAPEETEETTEE